MDAEHAVQAGTCDCVLGCVTGGICWQWNECAWNRTAAAGGGGDAVLHRTIVDTHTRTAVLSLLLLQPAYCLPPLLSLRLPHYSASVPCTTVLPPSALPTSATVMTSHSSTTLLKHHTGMFQASPACHDNKLVSCSENNTRTDRHTMTL